jgi:hypothetical protein
MLLTLRESKNALQSVTELSALPCGCPHHQQYVMVFGNVFVQLRIAPQNPKPLFY